MADRPIQIGINNWNQYTDWPSLLEAGKRVDRLGYESLWTWVLDIVRPSSMYEFHVYGRVSADSPDDATELIQETIGPSDRFIDLRLTLDGAPVQPEAWKRVTEKEDAGIR